MKKLFLLLLVPALIGFMACNGDDDEDTNGDEDVTVQLPEEIKTYQPLDLSEYGYEMVLYAPDSMDAPSEVTVNNAGEVEVRAGAGYSIQVAELAPDYGLEAKRIDILEDGLFRGKILEEEGNAILYRNDLPDGSQSFHHFYAVVDINGIKYEVKSIEDGELYSEKTARKMMQAGKLLMAKEVPEEEVIAETEN